MARKDDFITKLDPYYIQQYNAYKRRRQKRKKRLFRRLLVFSALVLLIVGSMATYHVKQRILHAEMTDEYERLEERLGNLQAAEKSLREEIALLNSDEYILDLARSNYFFSKEGELIFNIVEDDSTD